MTKHLKFRNKIKQRTKSLRIYFAKEAFRTITLSVFISSLIVCLVSIPFRSYGFSHKTVIIYLIITGLLTVLISGHLLMFKVKKIVAPIEDINRGLQQIAKGDFNAYVEKQVSPHKQVKEIQKLIENLNRTAKALQGMSFMQKDFIQNVSHEIKTPLSTISASVQMLKDSNRLAPQQKEEIYQFLENETKRLDHLCAQMLQLSQINQESIITLNDSIRIDEQIRKTLIPIVLHSEFPTEKIEIDLPELKYNH